MCFDLKSVTLVIPLTLSLCLLLLSLLSSVIICSMRNYLQAKSIFAPIANDQAQKLDLIDVLVFTDILVNIVKLITGPDPVIDK